MWSLMGRNGSHDSEGATMALTLSLNSERAKGLRWLSRVQEGPRDE